MSAALNEAISRHKAGDLAGAESLYRRVLQDDPGNLAALVYLAAIALGSGDAAAAAKYADRALAAAPRHAPAWNIKGLVHVRAGDARAALDCYGRALACDPLFHDAAANRAAALLDLGDAQGAAEACRAVLAVRSDAACQCILGIALFQLERFVEAASAFDAALTLAPGMAEAHNGKANLLRRLGRLEEAIFEYSQAIACNPRFADAYSNRGIAWQYLRCYAEALSDYEAAIARVPGHADAHWNRALVLLLRGDYARGWAEYEWRWQSTAMRGLARVFPVPQWHGEEIAGRTILIHAEQGLGDTLQFCRYVALVAARGARVVLEVPRPLARLLAHLEGASQIITAGDVFPPFDLHCPMLSLPLLFGTTLETVPGRVPYVRPDAALAAEWRARLGPRSRPRVGVVWAGRSTHHNDHNRSLPAGQLAPWRDLPIAFHCLQKEVTPADRALLGAWMTFHDGDLNDLADTAALAAAMDVVVTVDTSAAHLAGALGLPVWVMLPFAGDYRWLEMREDSPWYPTARLFRQQSTGDWPAVIARVADALRQRG